MKASEDGASHEINRYGVLGCKKGHGRSPKEAPLSARFSISTPESKVASQFGQLEAHLADRKAFSYSQQFLLANSASHFA